MRLLTKDIAGGVWKDLWSKGKGAKGLNHEPYHNNMRNNGNSIISYWENGHDTQWDFYYKMRRESGQTK